MSPSESTSPENKPMDKLRLLAEMSDSKEIGVDIEGLKAILEDQNDIREKLKATQRDLDILRAA